MNSPKVSVIIPVYNAEKYLSETIESILNQTYKNIEIIIVDDSSTDKSFDIVNSYKSKTCAVYKINNSGASAARNFGLSKSTGELIQFLDADDLLSNNKIKAQVELYNNLPKNYIFSCSWGRFEKKIDTVQINKQKVWKDYSNSKDWLLDSWIGGGMMPNSAWLIPRELLGESGIWNESLSLNDDGEFFSRVILSSSGIKYCENELVYYRSNIENSLSKQRSYKAIESAFKVCELYEKNILKFDNSQKVINAIIYNYMYFIYEYNIAAPLLAKKCKQRIKELQVDKLPLLGGEKFKFLSKYFGFWVVIEIKTYFSKIRNLIRSISPILLFD